MIFLTLFGIIGNGCDPVGPMPNAHKSCIKESERHIFTLTAQTGQLRRRDEKI